MLEVAVVDTSVLISIINNEPACAAFVDALNRCARLLIHPATYAEIRSVVINSLGVDRLKDMDELLYANGVEVVYPEMIDAHIKHLEYCMTHYGAGAQLGSPIVNIAAAKPINAKPAKMPKPRKPFLNFGDSFPYALAKEQNVPLLFQGKDFAIADVENAMMALGYQYDANGSPGLPQAQTSTP